MSRRGNLPRSPGTDSDMKDWSGRKARFCVDGAKEWGCEVTYQYGNGNESDISCEVTWLGESR